ncbi:MAG: flagellar basal body P-ring protein FlgI [Phycisphaerae bacterium]|nr:flagellar basal body P-ring protein FlgI [Phycisphaerae bacterium]
MMKINNIKIKFTLALLSIALMTIDLGAATRIRDIAKPLGERTNKLVGWGLVTGLNGTGDGGDLLITARPMLSMLQNMGNPASSPDEIKDSKNIAVVEIYAETGRNGVRAGEKIDVRVNSIGKAKSLKGGHLFIAQMISANKNDDTLYAIASGSITLDDPEVPTTGIIVNGAQMEIDFMHGYVDRNPESGRYYFDLVLDKFQDSWQTTREIALQIDQMISPPGIDEDYDNSRRGPVMAIALDAKNIRVYAPQKQISDPAVYIARIMNLPIDMPEPEATISINSKTNTIAVTGNVELGSGSVMVNNITVKVGVDADGQPIPGSANINELIEAFDTFQVPMTDRIDAIYELQKANLIYARVI